MKKFFTYPVFVVLFLSFIGVMGFGAIVKYNYDGGKKYHLLQKIAMFIVETPFRIKKIIDMKSLDLNSVEKLSKHKNKLNFKQFIENKRNALLVLPRYDHYLKRSLVEIVDLNNFKTIHTYMHDIDEMNKQINNSKEFPRLNIDNSEKRFLYQHPLIFDDGTLTGIGGPAYKLDFCSNILWINDEEYFHHSQMIDHEGNIWTGGYMNPKSKLVRNFLSEKSEKLSDDSIVKIDNGGKILFNKSVLEILDENNIIIDNYSSRYDPIHLNDIEPTFSDTDYWKKGDLFLNIRTQDMIVHYRPSNNRVINIIRGPFTWAHDVDVISDKEISIFNNNNNTTNSDHSEIIIYNFEKKKFRRLFNRQLKKENFKTITEGLHHIFKDGSLMVEEQNHGRIILLNNQGEKEWEYINKDDNEDIGYITWSRVIENELFIKNFKLMVKNKQCSN
ncbi:arylsulfotransferase family protein [Candidatus Pelagibacter sp.]|nr:arylsulfotransferase family protein [Candidatus Pelagibacter sp.]